jgi:hypothetical protein
MVKISDLSRRKDKIRQMLNAPPDRERGPEVEAGV